MQVAEERGPAGIRPQVGALLQYETLGLFDSQFLDHELEARARTILPLTQAGKDSADGLGDGEQLLLGEKLVEQLRGLRHGAQPAPDHELEPSLDLAAHLPRARDGAHVVEVREPTGVLFAP